MKLKKFNESKVESDEEIIQDCATIITYEFEDIFIDIDEDDKVILIQGFSFSGKQLNFDDPRSKLFFEFVRLIKECKPKYWLLEI